jgi:hypothetical protein
MDKKVIEYLNNVTGAFSNLAHEVQRLRTQLKADKALPCWLHEHSSRVRQHVYRIVSQLEYHDDQDPKETIVYPGIVAASKTTIKHIQQINHYKDDFQDALVSMKKAKIKMDDPYIIDAFEELFHKLFRKRNISTASALRKIGLSRLNLKQCYRHIPLLKKRPQKISWTWANTRAITKITAQEAYNLLCQRRIDAGIKLQLEKLSYLHPKEELAIVQELAPHLRANIVFVDPKTTEVTRKMIKGPLPIFYYDPTGQILPAINPPKEKRGKDSERKPRSDIKIDPEPFLPALRVHRYLSEPLA